MIYVNNSMYIQRTPEVFPVDRIHVQKSREIDSIYRKTDKSFREILNSMVATPIQNFLDRLGREYEWHSEYGQLGEIWLEEQSSEAFDSKINHIISLRKGAMDVEALLLNPFSRAETEKLYGYTNMLNKNSGRVQYHMGYNGIPSNMLVAVEEIPMYGMGDYSYINRYLDRPLNRLLEDEEGIRERIDRDEIYEWKPGWVAV